MGLYGLDTARGLTTPSKKILAYAEACDENNPEAENVTEYLTPETENLEAL